MINLLNMTVKHKLWGLGKVVEQEEGKIKVQFSNKESIFVLPDAFESFLKCEDASIQEQLVKEAKIKKEQKKEEIQRKLDTITDDFRRGQGSCQTSFRKNAYPKENIAFKCNFCDGGLNENGIGYLGACSDEMIHYNIQEAKHTWCSYCESPCKQYYDGKITREQLDEQKFICYESEMLRSWTAFAGATLTKGEEKPKKLNQVQVNSLAILTTREPNSKEEDRFVFGVFLVDEAYEGDNREAGHVTTSSKYKIYLTKEEARKILFWNYHCNENKPEKLAWSSGLHRYIKDSVAASMLKDIAEVKKGTEDEILAQEFFEHFCEINGLNPEDFPVLEGALNYHSRLLY